VPVLRRLRIAVIVAVLVGAELWQLVRFGIL
jgi:cell division protein ZapA (FtsZ GTPase activity inhibitor)